MFQSRFFIAAFLVVISMASAAEPVRSQAPPAGGISAPPQSIDRAASARASLKARFGFTDAQAATAVRRVQAIADSYKPKIKTLNEKYGTNPTTEQRRKMQAEIIPLVSEITKKANAVLMSVATKEQRPKIIASFKTEQQKIEKMR